MLFYWESPKILINLTKKKYISVWVSVSVNIKLHLGRMNWAEQGDYKKRLESFLQKKVSQQWELTLWQHEYSHLLKSVEFILDLFKSDPIWRWLHFIYELALNWEKLWLSIASGCRCFLFLLQLMRTSSTVGNNFFSLVFVNDDGFSSLCTSALMWQNDIEKLFI